MSDLTEVVLVGGSTRIPFIRKMVEKLTGKKLHANIDPDKAIAWGAAIQAAILAGIKNDNIEDVVINDVTPLALGIETEGGVMAHIIQMNETVPIKRSQTFRPASSGQSSVMIHILQGPNKMAKKNTSLGQFSLSEIGKNYPEIEVTFEIDANQVVKVTAVEKGNNQSHTEVLNNAGTMSSEEKERIMEEFKANEETDRIQADTVTTKQRVISQATQLASSANSEEVKNSVNELLNEVNRITELTEEGLKKAQECEAKLKTLLQMYTNASAEDDESGNEEEMEVEDDDEL